MKAVVDVHTHTVSSGHAYNTLLENIKEASNKGIKILGVSDHGPDMPGGPHIFHFANLDDIPRKLYGVKILRGCEANIIDYEGNLDIPERIARRLDYMIASLHDVCIKSGTIEENTNAIIGAIKNKDVFIIGHSGNPKFPIDMEKVVIKAKEEDKIIELNNSSFVNSRKGSDKNCYKIAELCKQYGVKMIFGSDAHNCFNIGEFSMVQKLVEDIDFPKELIMNYDEKMFTDYLQGKGKNI